jgi:hypothetical protein
MLLLLLLFAVAPSSPFLLNPVLLVVASELPFSFFPSSVVVFVVAAPSFSSPQPHPVIPFPSAVAAVAAPSAPHRVAASAASFSVVILVAIFLLPMIFNAVVAAPPSSSAQPSLDLNLSLFLPFILLLLLLSLLTLLYELRHICATAAKKHDRRRCSFRVFVGASPFRESTTKCVARRSLNSGSSLWTDERPPEARRQNGSFDAEARRTRRSVDRE